MRRVRAPVLATAEQLPAAPQQSRSQQKRRKLLEAARSLFAEKGFEATSIEQITSRAGTATGAFYTYFRSKQQLLLVLMNELIEGLSKVELRPEGAFVGPATLRTFLARVFRIDLESFGVIRAWQESSLTDPTLAAMRATVESWSESRILAVFQALQNDSGARADRDLRAFARMMDRHFWSLLAKASTMRKSEFDRQIRLAADVIHHYLFRDRRGAR